MKTRHPLAWFVAPYLIVVSNAVGQITIVNPGGAAHIANSNCPAGDGANALQPDPVGYLPPPAAGAAILTELAGGDTPFAGWTFNVGTAFSGTLTIDKYQSKFVADHNSGGDIDIRYQRAATDCPAANLRWIQMVTTSDPLAGATSPYIDPFPSDDPAGMDRPFYWTEAEHPTYSGGANFDLRFVDFSKRFHPPNSNVTWRADLYLVCWDGNTPGVVTIRDGVRWGWNASCTVVPTVSEWGLVVMALIGLTAGTIMYGRRRVSGA